MKITRNNVTRIELEPNDTVWDLHAELGRTAHGAKVSVQDGALITSLEIVK